MNIEELLKNLAEVEESCRLSNEPNIAQWLLLAQVEISQLAQKLEAEEKSSAELIDERDSCEAAINDLCEAAGHRLGFDFEWSSAYGKQEAINDVEEKTAEREARIKALSAQVEALQKAHHTYRVKVVHIANDFIPSDSSQNELALSEMREALFALTAETDALAQAGSDAKLVALDRMGGVHRIDAFAAKPPVKINFPPPVLVNETMSASERGKPIHCEDCDPSFLNCWMSGKGCRKLPAARNGRTTA